MSIGNVMVNFKVMTIIFNISIYSTMIANFREISHFLLRQSKSTIVYWLLRLRST